MFIPWEKRTKLSPNATKCIFLGYETDGEFSYRLWDVENRKLIRSSDIVFNEDCILSQNPHKIVGKKDSFKTATDGVEAPTHQSKLALRQRAEENEVSADPDSENDPLDELEDKAINDKDESTRVEKGKVSKTRVGNDRVNPTDTPKAKGQSRNESTKSIDLKHGGG